ncbi:MAG: sulfurtransferase TusA family protein [bacterium]
MPGGVSKPKQVLDCIGLYCPVPLFRTREEIDKLEVGEVLEVLSDDPAAEEDLKRFAKRTGHKIIKFERKEDSVRFLIKKEK